MTTSIEAFTSLLDQVDGFFSRVHAKHRSSMKCGQGCTRCCQSGLTVTVIEAVAIVQGLAMLDEGDRGELARDAREAAGEQCVALDDTGACRIYENRPLVCRSHGVPIRRREPDEGGPDDGKRHLPVVEVCELNFAGPGELERVSDEDVLDQVTLSTALATVEAAFADENGLERGVRIVLAELLADPGSVFELDEV